MFTRITDFVQCAGHQIEVRVERSSHGEIRFGFVAPGTSTLAPIDGLGPFDTADQALGAVKRWVTNWAARRYG